LPKSLTNKIHEIDTIELLRKIPNDCIDAIIADPPYNIGKDFGNNNDRLGLAEYKAWCNEWITECFRVLKPSGTMFIYGFSEILAHISVSISHEQRWLIWHYTNKNVASLNFWQRSHESIICTWKGKPLFDRDAVREPYTDGFLKGSAGKKRQDTVGRFSTGGKETTYVAHEKGALPRDVLKIPALAGGAGRVERWFLCHTCDDAFPPNVLKLHTDHETEKHPTQKPLELTRRLLKSSLPAAEATVLIPFAGTGSECLVAKELGATYIASEINPAYIKLAEAMLRN
jgi:site-specific DNA-methyltransferase (adenine-specific)